MRWPEGDASERVKSRPIASNVRRFKWAPDSCARFWRSVGGSALSPCDRANAFIYQVA
jgi:hypothetical protein